MSVSASRTRRLLDAAAAVTLRATGSGPVTATTLEAAIPLDRLRGVLPGQDAVVPHTIVMIAVNVASLHLSTNEYTLELLSDSVAGMNVDPTVLLAVPLSSLGLFQVGFDTGQAPPSHDWLAARVVVGGVADSPSIDWSAWLVESRAQ